MCYSTHEHLPCLLHLDLRPVMAAHVSRDVVGFVQLNQGAENWIRYHNKEGQNPSGSDDFVGVGSGLPCT